MFRKIHRKAPLPESCNNVAGLRSTALLINRLWYRCFPVNFAKFLRIPLLQNTSGRRFWYRFSWNWNEHIYNFFKKEALAQGFSCQFCEIFKNTFFTEHLSTTASSIDFREIQMNTLGTQMLRCFFTHTMAHQGIKFDRENFIMREFYHVSLITLGMFQKTVNWLLVTYYALVTYHCINTVISHNFLVQKCCGNTRFPQNFGRFFRNSVATLRSHNISKQKIRWNLGILHRVSLHMTKALK